MYSFIILAITTPPGNCSHGDLRLEGGRSDSENGTKEGRLEICLNNAWGTVCSSAFGNNDAMVACNQLTGFRREGKYIRTYATKYDLVGIVHSWQLL